MQSETKKGGKQQNLLKASVAPFIFCFMAVNITKSSREVGKSASRPNTATVSNTTLARYKLHWSCTFLLARQMPRIAPSPFFLLRLPLERFDGRKLIAPQLDFACWSVSARVVSGTLTPCCGGSLSANTAAIWVGCMSAVSFSRWFTIHFSRSTRCFCVNSLLITSFRTSRVNPFKFA